MVSIRIRRLYRRSYEDIPQTLFQRQRFVGKRQKTYWPCPPHSDFATIPNFIFPSHFSTANGKTSILRTLELPGRYLPREYLLITGMKTQRRDHASGRFCRTLFAQSCHVRRFSRADVRPAGSNLRLRVRTSEKLF